MKETFQWKQPAILLLLCVVTFICFHYSLGNQFTNWDDDYYITRDEYIKAFTPHNLKVIFTEDITKNNYHPLTMLSLAINYHFAQMNPWSYYLTNILIHILNVVLVFFFFARLCTRLKLAENSKLFIAGFGALLFGIHPMHVESVSWIAERKDVLYACFYLQGLLCYLTYTRTDQKKWYWLAYAAFIASCLSKPMAVVFPLSLLCLDFFLQRQGMKKLVLEKVLFFATSLFFGLMAFYTQNKTGAVADFGILTIWERFMYAAYGFVMYVSKVFNPTYLSTFYPYPYRYITGYLPGIYYAAPVLALGIIALPLFLTWKFKREYFKIAVFGMGFFVANVLFVLQFISVGAAIMADRYSYVAYIGLFFLIPFFIDVFVRKFPDVKTMVYVALFGCSIALGYTCYERTFVWHDARALLSDAIAKYPYRALLSYKWLGNYYLDKGELDSAMANYEVLTTLRAADDKVLRNIDRINALRNAFGVTGAGQGMPAGAQQGALGQGAVPPGGSMAAMPVQQMPTGDYKLYLDSCMGYLRKGDTLKAFRNYVMAFRFNPNTERMLAEAAFKYIQESRFVEAVGIYNIIMKINTSNPFYYFYKGVGEFGTQKLKAAIYNWEIAVKMDSKDVQQSASYNLCVAYDSIGNDSAAVRYAQLAEKYGYKVSPEYMAKLKAKAAAKAR